MKYDILKKLRAILLADPTIASHVGTNIKVRELPVTRVGKQITLRKTFGTSDSIIPLCRPDVFISVWVKQKEVTEPYKVTTEIVEKIIDLLNRKGESLNINDLIVNQIVRVDADISYNDEEEYWIGMIHLECVIND
jgi:hypothetical protein